MKKISTISLIIFFIDRITKLLVTNFFKLDVRNTIINKFFYITNCHNEGAAFSILSGNVSFLIVMSVLVIIIIFKMIKNKKNISNLLTISFGLLLGGIIGNLFDRIIYGYVIDFLDFTLFNYDFAIFNISDVCILIGAFLYIFFERSDENEKNEIIS